jgi:nucleoside-diphosphate-sugar epimerase
VNVGSGKGTTIRELAERILKLTNSDSKIRWLPGRDVEVVRYVADTARARTLLGLEHRDDPLFRLSELIAWTAKESLPEIARSFAV